MPFYDYHCESCDSYEEHQHGMTERPTIQCSTCHTPMLKCLAVPNLGAASVPTRKLGKM